MSSSVPPPAKLRSTTARVAGGQRAARRFLIACGLGLACGIAVAPLASRLLRSATFLQQLAQPGPTTCPRCRKVELGIYTGQAPAPQAASSQPGGTQAILVRTQRALTQANPAPILSRLACRKVEDHHASPGRLYLPPAGTGPGIVVAHGIHPLGLDEPRLLAFAQQLSNAGYVVLTPYLADLAHFRISEQGLDTLRGAVAYLQSEVPEVASERVGLLGFSFAGGLALRLATEPRAQEHLAFVASVGGYHDLSRVLHFYLDGTVRTPGGKIPGAPHPYGLLVALYNHLGQLVPEHDQLITSHAVEAWLSQDTAQSAAWAAQRSSTEAERILEALNSENWAPLRPRLRRLLRHNQQAMKALSSRGRLKQSTIPIHLLHSQEDTIIPPSESQWASLELQGLDHSLLISPLLQHANLAKTAGLGSQLDLLLFVSELLPPER